MKDNRRLVYSTEQGQLEKPMRNAVSGSRKANKSASAINKPGKQGIRICRESKGRGGKTVSVVEGLALTEADLKVLLKKLKGKLGCGGAVKNGVLEIQGEHRDKLLLLLEKEGFKAKLSGG